MISVNPSLRNMPKIYKTVENVVKSGLCTSCGICAGSCRNKCISFIYGKERNIPQIDHQNCIKCGACYNVCPGKGINLLHLSEALFKTDDNVRYNLCSGYYQHAYVGHSTDEDIRYHSATGGMVTQFLIWLLKTKEIDGAVVVRYKEGNPFETESFIATTEKEIWDSRSSKYVVVSMDNVAKNICDTPYKRLVVVGLPCQIQGWRMLASRNKIIRDKIRGYFAIYCSLNKTKLSLSYYLWRYKVNKNEVGRFTFRDDGCMGYMKFVDKCGKDIKKIPYLHYWFGTHSFFANSRCSLCIDQLGELADVSFGDIHIEPYLNDHIGTNSIITRSTLWDSLLNKCYNDNHIDIEEIPIETVVKSQSYAKDFKKSFGVKANFKLRKLMRMRNPQYDYVFKGDIGFVDLMREALKAIMRMIGRHRQLWFVVKVLDRNKD